MSDEKKILDSGTRRTFDTGAVRDVQEGKGRCDLLPLAEIAEYFKTSTALAGEGKEPRTLSQISMANILNAINDFLYNRDSSLIYFAINTFMDGVYMKTGQGIMELAKHYEGGAKKYNERNWEIGIPLHCYVDSGVRHLLKYYDGWQDEPHDRAFMWNMFGLLWTFHNKPELDDLPRYECPVEDVAEIK